MVGKHVVAFKSLADEIEKLIDEHSLVKVSDSYDRESIADYPNVMDGMLTGVLWSSRPSNYFKSHVVNAK